MMVDSGFPLPSTFIQTGLVLNGFDMDLSDVSERELSPTQSEFPELTPYSTASSFNLPSNCDASLLTPTSALSSPSYSQLSKLGVQYIRSPTTPYFQQQQQLSPPMSSGIYPPWNNPFDMSAPNSQASSPMTNQASLSSEMFAETNYTTLRSSTNGNSQLQPSNSQSTSMQVPRLPSNGTREIATAAAQEAQTVSATQTPTTQRPLPKSKPTDSTSALSPRSSGIKKSKKSRKHRAAALSPLTPEYDLAATFLNCNGDEVRPKLQAKCPAELKCIFESRWRHREKRGQDMWDAIQQDFKDQFGIVSGKETLQMRFKRGRSQYYDWLDKDVDILRQAWLETERERYKTILDRFHKLGGSKNMLLCPSDIEVKVVSGLKLEEGLYADQFEEQPIRRRHRLTARKRAIAINKKSSAPDIDVEETIRQVEEKNEAWPDESSDCSSSEDDDSSDMGDSDESDNTDVTMSDAQEAKPHKSSMDTIAPLAHPSQSGSGLYQRRRG